MKMHRKEIELLQNDYNQTLWLKQQAVANVLHKQQWTNFIQMMQMEAAQSITCSLGTGLEMQRSGI